MDEPPIQPSDKNFYNMMDPRIAIVEAVLLEKVLLQTLRSKEGWQTYA